MQLEKCAVANWQNGAAAIYAEAGSDKSVFVTPPIDDWVLVAGLALPQPLGDGFADKCTPLVARLSEKFGEAQYFLAYPQLNYFCWIRASDGRVRRAFATGDEGLIWNRGNQTGGEKALGLKFYELRGVDDRDGDTGGALNLAPTEAQVMALAAHWSVDPSSLGARTLGEPGSGLIGTAPAAWRPERAMRVAA